MWFAHELSVISILIRNLRGLPGLVFPQMICLEFGGGRGWGRSTVHSWFYDSGDTLFCSEYLFYLIFSCCCPASLRLRAVDWPFLLLFLSDGFHTVEAQRQAFAHQKFSEKRVALQELRRLWPRSSHTLDFLALGESKLFSHHPLLLSLSFPKSSDTRRLELSLAQLARPVHWHSSVHLTHTGLTHTVIHTSFQLGTYTFNVMFWDALR
jgi:hypothetical protein